jgi:hypothetical protein
MEPTYPYAALHSTPARNLWGTVALLPVCIYYCYGAIGGRSTIFDAVSLFLREAGHTLGGLVGGEAAPLLGVAVFPLLLPITTFIFFTIHRFMEGKQLSLFVLGQSMFEGSGLLAQNESGDWSLVLQHFGYPEAIPVIDNVLVLGGLFVFAGCLLLPFFEED